MVEEHKYLDTDIYTFAELEDQNISSTQEEDGQAVFCEQACVCIKMLMTDVLSVQVSAVHFDVFFLDQESKLCDWLHFGSCGGEEVSEQTVMHHGYSSQSTSPGTSLKV